jgi:hypothetical protein
MMKPSIGSFTCFGTVFFGFFQRFSLQMFPAVVVSDMFLFNPGIMVNEQVDVRFSTL